MRPPDQSPRDKNDKRHGEWIGYYDDGNLCYLWIYFHGVYHGLHLGYDTYGSVSYKGYYNMGRKVGYWHWVVKRENGYYLWLI